MEDEHGGRQLDARGDAEREALADGLLVPGQIPQDEADEGKVDLAEEERLEDRFEPEAHGDGGEHQRLPLGKPGEPAGEPHQQREQQRVPDDKDHLERRDGQPGGRYEEDRGEGGYVAGSRHWVTVKP